MKLLVGLMKPSTGTVCLHGRSLRADVRPEALSREVSMVYQNPEDMFIKDSIEKDIAYAMEARGVPDVRPAAPTGCSSVSVCPACGTGTAACSRAGRCAEPAWPSG